MKLNRTQRERWARILAREPSLRRMSEKDRNIVKERIFENEDKPKEAVSRRQAKRDIRLKIVRSAKQRKAAMTKADWDFYHSIEARNAAFTAYIKELQIESGGIA